MKIESLKETPDALLLQVSVESNEDFKSLGNDLAKYEKLLTSSKGILFTGRMPLIIAAAVVRRTIAPFIALFYPQEGKYVVIVSNSKKISIGDRLDM